MADFSKLWLYNYGRICCDGTTVNQGQLWLTLANHGCVTMGSHCLMELVNLGQLG